MNGSRSGQADTVIDSIRQAVRAKSQGQPVSVMQQQAQESRDMQQASRARQVADIAKYANN